MARMKLLTLAAACAVTVVTAAATRATTGADTESRRSR